MIILRLLAVFAVFAAIVAAGCSSQSADTSAKNDKDTTAPQGAAPTQGTAPATADPDAPAKGDKVAVIDTNYGQIVFKFLPDKAPNTVKNFISLANKHFYDGTKFHRVIPGFMIQGGDPLSKESDRSKYGTGGPGYAIRAEFNSTKHERGIVSMARSSDPDSAGSQFFIMVAAAPSLDGQYSAFGKVVSGMDVVDKIVNLERDDHDDPVPGKEAVMKKVEIKTWPLK